MPPTLWSGGEGTPACWRGVGGVPIPTRGYTLWCSIYMSTLWLTKYLVLQCRVWQFQFLVTCLRVLDPDWYVRIQVWILPFKQGKVRNWQILRVHNRTAARLWKHFKDFYGKCVFNHTRIWQLWSTFLQKWYTFLCQIGLIRSRIRLRILYIFGQKVA